jgi:two-component sensor histidine kinase
MPDPRVEELEAEVARLRAALAARGGAEALNAELRRANAELADSQRHRDLLLAELSHRVKNILATVQGLAAQTLKGTGGDPGRFARHFGARLRTLARAHDMLAAGGWDPAGLGDTLRTALAPWLETGRAIRFDIAGDGLGSTMSPRQAQALVLAFHELATNATKHGALSAPEGRVEIGCRAGADGSVEIRWAEMGGPPVARPPDRRGFGTRLLERGLAQDLGPGSGVELRFEPAGLRATVRFAPTAEPRWPVGRPRIA